MGHVPFLNSAVDSMLCAKYHRDAAVVRRTALTTQSSFLRSVDFARTWYDPAFDGMHLGSYQEAVNARAEPAPQAHRIYAPEWVTHMDGVGTWREIKKPEFQRRPDTSLLRDIVSGLLEPGKGCAWITVPQFPYVDDASRNRVNRKLAEAAAEWKIASKTRTRFVYPVVLTSAKQYLKKTPTNGQGGRNRVISLARQCYEAAGAEGLWVADSNLDDQLGTGSFTKRFPALIALHEELGASLPNAKFTTAGPYWGLNLVLWCRGLVSDAAIGLGASYRYTVSGSVPWGSPVTRVALAPLRRWHRADAGEFAEWVEGAAQATAGTDAELAFREVRRIIPRVLLSKDRARGVLAKFYRGWLRELETTAAQGRAALLFQQFAAAFAVGRSLNRLPKAGNEPRDPAIVAQQLMLNCL